MDFPQVENEDVCLTSSEQLKGVPQAALGHCFYQLCLLLLHLGMTGIIVRWGKIEWMDAVLKLIDDCTADLDYSHIRSSCLSLLSERIGSNIVLNKNCSIWFQLEDYWHYRKFSLWRKTECEVWWHGFSLYRCLHWWPPGHEAWPVTVADMWERLTHWIDLRVLYQMYLLVIRHHSVEWLRHWTILVLQV